MNLEQSDPQTRPCWFVGAVFSNGEDQLSRFLKDGVWEIEEPNPRDRSLVNDMKVGDRIAVKSTFTRKNNLPFDNRGNSVSVMAIKAVGKVIENPGNGRLVKVEWRYSDQPREWYFYTFRGSIWRVSRDSWDKEALIDFTFSERPQDIDGFRNAPFWRDRYGDKPANEIRFSWTRFYESVADKLLEYRRKRADLLEGIFSISKRVEGLSAIQDRFSDGSVGELKDICPFTVFGMFNRGITDDNRRTIATELAKLLDVTEPIPESFEGIPLVNNQRSWFFGFEKDRAEDDIDALWDIFEKAIQFAEVGDEQERNLFVAAYDNAAKRFGVGWNLTMGLYWIRPWSFPTLESQSQEYIKKRLGIKIGLNGPKRRCNAKDYLLVLDTLETRFKEDAYPVHSFPELSLAAWKYEGEASEINPPQPEPPVDEETVSPEESIKSVAPADPYSIDDILNDGCFLSLDTLEKILERLRTKKNIILQGPPGTGKTWLAKRLAFSLIEKKSHSKLRAVQFHPNLSYEDFIRGWRPSGEGKLTLVDGPFLQIVESASTSPMEKHVLVIEEINRGNPAQIFGEMLTLIEADKRTPEEALELCYRKSEDERIFVPENLYIIGTMNIADRSLALVDLALRRRFAFVDLEPAIGQPWREWVGRQNEIDPDILMDIEQRITKLNNDISSDTSLGPQFRVGHSYVTPPMKNKIKDAREWFRQVVKTEIGPLLAEYWFDAPEKADKACNQLLDGI